MISVVWLLRCNHTMRCIIFLLIVAYASANYNIGYLSEEDADISNEVEDGSVTLTAQMCKDQYTACAKKASWWAKKSGYKKCKANVLWACCNDLHQRCRAKAVNLKDYMKCQDEMFACKLPPKIEDKF
ncbi:uncharacterized protein LOC130654669 [Hydractinia symbiolongicarpus]|uniref:uncharacterized protein LOC130654669 n=1 Tax=Hydractinia symbiolongicarpus TaxID=13093 RepID=UPI00254A4D63|nr:uncharacterized protein LOC130654669 [Hydractinia symbiolongicarpus]XP_057313264.1 uncharacterized protein LOC130654669 [Hydractinia symbiolongicarpus]